MLWKKILNLLEKVYIELQESKKELSDDIKKLSIKVENDLSQKVDVLYEDRDYVHNELKTIKEKVEKIEANIDKHALKYPSLPSRAGLFFEVILLKKFFE